MAPFMEHETESRKSTHRNVPILTTTDEIWKHYILNEEEITVETSKQLKSKTLRWNVEMDTFVKMQSCHESNRRTMTTHPWLVAKRRPQGHNVTRAIPMFALSQTKHSLNFRWKVARAWCEARISSAWLYAKMNTGRRTSSYQKSRGLAVQGRNKIPHS